MHSDKQILSADMPEDMQEPQGKAPMMLKGNSNSVAMQNVKELMQRKGMGEVAAHKMAMANQKGHPNRHKNLKNFLHPRKDGKQHES